MRDLALYPPLMEKMKHLIGEDMLLHLCLTGWVSTERQWHQDEYLSPDFVCSWYAAVWIALDTITPDSGPFEYVPGSHSWPLVNGEKVRGFMTPEERAMCDPVTGTKDWPKLAERFVTPAFEDEIKKRRANVVPFLAEKGDVLIWHGRLAHQGSLAKERGKPRRSLIAHYTGVNHRPDMPARAVHELGGQYALFDTPLKA
jgi:ectoine hydroxylase-related dioxygenase (phytanoyl-CoA dioxygenase family)